MDGVRNSQSLEMSCLLDELLGVFGVDRLLDQCWKGLGGGLRASSKWVYLTHMDDFLLWHSDYEC